MTAINAVSNCLHGTISSKICESKSLELLDFDGAGMNPMCQPNVLLNEYKPFFVGGTFSQLGLTGTIPSCLYHMPSIKTMHLAGMILTNITIRAIGQHLLVLQ